MNPPFTVLRVHSLNCITIVVLTNRYRHPSYLTLKRLEAYGVKIYRSDFQGMVKIVYYGGKNYVMTSSGF